MLISDAVVAKLNEQIVNEFFASNTYLAMACYFKRQGLHLLAKLFRKHAVEEREHALKIIDYIEDRAGKAELGAIPVPQNDFASVVEALEAAYEHEKMVSEQFYALCDLADNQKDKSTSNFLGWFIDEQVEEVQLTYQLLQAGKMAGPALLSVEAYLAHIGDD